MFLHLRFLVANKVTLSTTLLLTGCYGLMLFSVINGDYGDFINEVLPSVIVTMVCWFVFSQTGCTGHTRYTYFETMGKLERGAKSEVFRCMLGRSNLLMPCTRAGMRLAVRDFHRKQKLSARI